MPNYSVLESERSKELPATDKRGALIVYKLSLGVGDSRFPGVELLQKPETAAPAVGDTLEGQITQTEFGPRFKKAQMGGNNRGGGATGGRSPTETKAIVRQHSQEMALRAIAIALDLGVYERGQSGLSQPSELRTLIAKWSDWFVEDAAA